MTTTEFKQAVEDMNLFSECEYRESHYLDGRMTRFEFVGTTHFDLCVALDGTNLEDLYTTLRKSLTFRGR